MKTNYWAILVCAIAYWLLGGVWYDVLFSKQWMALEHMTEAQASSANPVWIWPFILTFLLNLLIAFVLAQICIWRNANTARARGCHRNLAVDWNRGADRIHNLHVRDAAEGAFRHQRILSTCGAVPDGSDPGGVEEKGRVEPAKKRR